MSPHLSMRIRLFGRTFLAFGRMCLEAFADLFAASAFASRTRARKSNNSQYEELTVSRSSCSSMIFCNLVSARPHWLQKLMIADFRRDRRKVQWNFLLARRSCLNVMRQTRRQAADPRKTVVHSNQWQVSECCTASGASRLGLFRLVGHPANIARSHNALSIYVSALVCRKYLDRMKRQPSA